MQTIKDNEHRLEASCKENRKEKLIYIFIKRLMDIIGSICGLVILSPILCIIAIIIKLTSKGPILHIQERVGLDEKIFKMYKFRSMVENAEELLEQLKDKNEMSGPMFKIKDDPRITKIGRILRKTSIDEIPQLINILKGEMSLVGPRPNLPREVQEFTAFQKQKFTVKPGLTCYWQVMGRNNIDFEEWMKLDIKYIEDRNLLLDFKLILMTVKVLFGDENAK